MRVRVIVNKSGGTSTGDDEEAARIEAAFDAAGVDADVRPTESGDIFDALKKAAGARGLDAVVAGGGDGTLSCAAGHLAGTKRPLGILPLGTPPEKDVGFPYPDSWGTASPAVTRAMA